MTEMSGLDETPAGTIALGNLRVQRLGFSAMRISTVRNADGGRNRDAAQALLRHAVERGVTFIDPANIYGIGRSEEIIAEALRPYPADLVIGAKSGFEVRNLLPGEERLPANSRPEHLTAECDASLRRRGRDHIDLYQLHVPDPAVPYEDSLGAFVELQQAGKVRHIGVSNVTAGPPAACTGGH